MVEQLHGDRKIVVEAVQRAARAIGILDVNMVGALDLSEIKVVDGGVEPAAIRKVLEVAVHTKPQIFDDPHQARLRLSDASTLKDADFDKLTAAIRAEMVPLHKRALPPELKRIDATRLTDDEHHALGAVLRGGSSHDRGIVIEAARKQNIDLHFEEN